MAADSAVVVGAKCRGYIWPVWSRAQASSYPLLSARQPPLTFEPIPARPGELGGPLNDTAADWSVVGRPSPFQPNLQSLKQKGRQQNQICCPIWALAMDQLDARQQQPRDQAASSHLIAAPSALGYLLTEPPAEPTGQPQQLDPESEVAGDSSSPASSNNSQRSIMTKARRRQFRRSSNESVEKQRHKQLDERGSVKRKQRARPTRADGSAKIEPISRDNKPDDWRATEQSAR